MEDANWEASKPELDRIFFKDFSLFNRGSPEHTEFWSFFSRYRQFQSRHSSASSKPEKRGDSSESVSRIFGLPRVHDKSYRIPLSVVTPDLSYKLRRVQERREDGRREESCLVMEHLTEFRTALRHFINFKQKQKFEKLVKIRRDQASLPISHYTSHILTVLHSHQVVIVAGDTGCGKSTQVPQYLLNAGYGKIACTQPRRIACLSLAKRVGFETLKEHGTEIAYQVRFEASKSPATKILFLTEGLLLRQLQTDPLLSWYDVLIIDEVHERHIHGDFLLGVLRTLVEHRQDMKLILMSATINIQLFSGYFDGAPVIKVPGRLYPIELEYVSVPSASQLGPPEKVRRSEKLDPKPYLKIMQKIDDKYPPSERGDMLVFLSGMNEISSVMEEAKVYAQQTHRWIVLPLHSALSIEEQDRVFDVAPDGVRKCILSTNIAETSITIDGVRFVVDSGKVKEMGYDSQAKMRRLQEFWISRASAEQRKGRAGRTGPGVCFRMYSESDYDSFSEYSTPEILRVPLDSLVLQLAALGIPDVRKFPFIEPPSLANIETSIAFLKEQGALYPNEKLTPIGRMLAQLPVDIVMGKMLIMGTLFHVIEPVLTIAAALSVQSPFSRVPLGHSDINVARRPLESEHGDPFTLLNAFEEWVQLKSGGGGAGSSHQWCRRRGLEQQRFYEMAKLRRQFQQILQEHGLFVKGGGGDGGRRRGRPLTEGQLQDLRRARKRHRTENRTRKMLRMDEEGGALSDGEEVESGTSELRDLEFKFFHNLADLQEASALRQSFSMRDTNVLKLVVCSGLYPQLAIADDCNSYRKDSDQVFHTKSKQFVVLHPTSVFATNPDHIDPAQRKTKDNIQQELLAYVDLLETNKPYLVSTMRTPALQTLTLFSQNIDTNADCTRLVVDEWLELKFSEPGSGEQVISAIQILRNTWTNVLEAKLQASQNRDEAERDRRLEKRVSTLENLLASKLAEFLDSRYSYSLRQLPSSVKTHLYKGKSSTPHEGSLETAPSAPDSSSSSSSSSAPRPFVSADTKPHPVKGGWCINEYLTYDCLLDEGAAGPEQYLRRVWSCPICSQTLALSLAEQLQHQSSCTAPPQDDTEEESGDQAGGLSSRVAVKDYRCPDCDLTLWLSSIAILKHKRMHALQAQEHSKQQ